MCGPMQRRLSKFILGIDIGSVLQQYLGDIAVSIPSGAVELCVSVLEKQ